MMEVSVALKTNVTKGTHISFVNFVPSAVLVILSDRISWGAYSKINLNNYNSKAGVVYQLLTTIINIIIYNSKSIEMIFIAERV